MAILLVAAITLLGFLCLPMINGLLIMTGWRGR